MAGGTDANRGVKATGPTRQREAIAGASGWRPAVTSTHGVAQLSAASDSRRAAVRSTASSTPTASNAARDLRASSSAHSTSAGRGAVTSSSAEVSRPRLASPGPWRRPCSQECPAVAHHATSGSPERASPPWPAISAPRRGRSHLRGRSHPCSMRRTASLSANPSARAPPAAASPELADPGGTGLISCTPLQSSPPPRAASSSWQPSVQGDASPASPDTSKTDGWRSISRTLARKRSRTSAATGAVRGRTRLRSSAAPAPDNAKPGRGQASGSCAETSSSSSSWGNGGVLVTALSHLKFALCSYYGLLPASIKKEQNKFIHRRSTPRGKSLSGFAPVGI